MRALDIVLTYSGSQGIVPTMIIIISTLGFTLEDYRTSAHTDSGVSTDLDLEHGRGRGHAHEHSTIHFKTVFTSGGGVSTTGYSDTDVVDTRESEVAGLDGEGGPKPNLSAVWQLPVH